MTSQFDFENDINSLMQLNKPLKSGPVARWERKAADSSTANNSLHSISVNIRYRAVLIVFN